MAFFNSAIDVLKILVVAIGAGLGAWGGINLLEGYGNDNPGAKSQGIKHNIMSILAIITNHDDYRVKSGTGLQSSTKTLPHSTKRQRKIANQVEKQNRRKKISHVLAMIEELEQIK